MKDKKGIIMNRLFVVLVSLPVAVVTPCGKTSPTSKTLKIAGGTAHLKVMNLENSVDFKGSVPRQRGDAV